jgi:hypothetical protein
MNHYLSFASRFVPVGKSCWARIIALGVAAGFAAAVVIPVHVH